jgi:hypothetical protein
VAGRAVGLARFRRGFATAKSGLRKGLVASPSDLLLAHAAWIEAEIPQKIAGRQFLRNWSG